MKKLMHFVAAALLVVSSATLIPTQNANAFFSRVMPWNWFNGPGWGGSPYYDGYYPYYGGYYPYYGGYPYGGYYPYYGGSPYYGGYPYGGAPWSRYWW